MRVWTIVVAAGSGSRFGGPKQLARLGRTTVLDRSVATACQVSHGVVVALPASGYDGWVPAAATTGTPEPPAAAGPAASLVRVTGGATRAASVRCGLRAVPGDAQIIVVHDAARPMASRALFAAVIGAVVGGADAAVPALAVVDTVKRVDAAGVATETVSRDGLVTVQTPQAFRAALLLAAHERAAEGTDDAMLVEAIGGRVVVVPGEARNVKITTAADLEIAAALLGAP